MFVTLCAMESPCVQMHAPHKNVSYCNTAGRSTITFANRGEGLVVNEEDNFVKVCLQRNGSVDQLEQSETVYIQAKETQPGTHVRTYVWMYARQQHAGSCAPVYVHTTMSSLFILCGFLYSCCTAEPMSGTGMDMTVEEETASGK